MKTYLGRSRVTGDVYVVLATDAASARAKFSAAAYGAEFEVFCLSDLYPTQDIVQKIVFQGS